MRKSKIKNLSAAVAALGFLLLLTELDGGPWAGTYVGAALLILGAVGALRGPEIFSALRLQFRNDRDYKSRTQGRRQKAALKNSKSEGRYIQWQS